MLVRFLMFGCLGIVWEVTFGAIKGIIFKRTYDLRGSSSLWVFPLYGLIAFLFPPVAHLFGTLTWWGRGLAYMATFFVLEYVAGTLLRRVNLCPWHYPPKYSVNGLIYLPYAPIWFLLGLGIEWIYPWLKAMSEVG